MFLAESRTNAKEFEEGGIDEVSDHSVVSRVTAAWHWHHAQYWPCVFGGHHPRAAVQDQPGRDQNSQNEKGDVYRSPTLLLMEQLDGTSRSGTRIRSGRGTWGMSVER